MWRLLWDNIYIINKLQNNKLFRQITQKESSIKFIYLILDGLHLRDNYDKHYVYMMEYQLLIQ